MDRSMTSASTTVRSRGPYRTGIRRREQIIDAATAVFAEYGYAGGSVRTIADRIGVSPASLLQHFGSKEGLLMAVLEDWDRRHRRSQPHRRDRAGLLPPTSGGHGCPPGESGTARAVLHHRRRGVQPQPSSPRVHPAPLHRQPRHPRHDTCSRRSTPATSRRSPRPRSTIEVRLVTAVLDGIGLQWLLDPSTDVIASISTYITHTIAGWRSGQ